MNGYLLDTNVPSEFSRERPEPHVVRWLKVQPVTSWFLSVITAGEIRKSLIVMPASRRRTELERWFHTELLTWFRNRILPATYAIADRSGQLEGQCQLQGSPLDTADGLIGGTGLEHGLTIVTRNQKHFAGLGAIVFNPWQL